MPVDTFKCKEYYATVKMKILFVLFFLLGVKGDLKGLQFSAWSQTYSLKAVLTIPSADISQPYQVWVDGASGKSRIDFYNGIDKIYKLPSSSGTFEYYKVHPQSTSNFKNKEVCQKLSPYNSLINIYNKTMYLPAKNFQYVHPDKINGVQAIKWEYKATNKYQTKTGLNSEFVYTVWTRFQDSSRGDDYVFAPLRYEYQMKANGIQLDYFRHDYSYFDDAEPKPDIFEIPNSLSCQMTEIREYEPVDPLLELIHPELETERVAAVFESFKLKHNKTYESDSEHENRMNIFKNNLRYINSINRQHKSFSVSVNHFADHSDLELSTLFGTKIEKDYNSDIDENNSTDENEIEDGNDDSTNFDWRDYGAVTSVKDQTILCGSCYAFASAASIESASYISKGCKNLQEVSEQALIDCTWSFESSGNMGCAGGTFAYTLAWAASNGVPYKKDYGPYLAMEGLCHRHDINKVANIEGFHRIPKNKNKIKSALRKFGPLSTTVNARPKTFIFYSDGVYDDQMCYSSLTDMNHGMNIIGYGKKSDQEYWILKNSYGSQWGEKGFMNIAMESNICGVTNVVYRVERKKNRVKKCFIKQTDIENPNITVTQGEVSRRNNAIYKSTILF